jgi:WD40-like Beta Propeller Repeat
MGSESLIGQSMGSESLIDATESAPYVTPDGQFLTFSADRAVVDGKPGLFRIWVIPAPRIDVRAQNRLHVCTLAAFEHRDLEYGVRVRHRTITSRSRTLTPCSEDARSRTLTP